MSMSRLNLSRSRATPEFKEAALLAHNQYRCMHGVQNLVWEDKKGSQVQRRKPLDVHEGPHVRRSAEVCVELLVFRARVHGCGSRGGRRTGQRRDRRALHPAGLGQNDAGRMRGRKDGPRLGPR